MKIKTHQLENGFKLISGEDRSNALVCLQLFVRIGSAWESKNEAGYSHLLEHLVFKSTERFPRNSIMEYVSDLGGNINAYTEYDSTCYYIILPAKFLDDGLLILSELVMHSNFNEEDFTFEKQVVLEEMKEYQNHPEENFLDTITNEYFSSGPYKNPIIGNETQIKAATKAELASFQERNYIPGNCFMVVTGDFNEADLFTKSEKYFRNWKPAKKISRKKLTPCFPKKFAIRSITKKIASDILAFVLPDVSDFDKLAYPHSVVTKVFSSGKNSRLYHRLFVEEKLIDGIKTHSFSGVNDGASIVIVMPKKGASISLIIKIFLDELKQFYLHGLNRIELENHKKELLHYHRYSFEYMETLAASLGNEELTLGYEEFFQYPQKIEKLTVNDVNNTIKQFFKLKNLHIYHCGNSKFDLTEIENYVNRQYKLAPAVQTKKDVFETELSNGMKILLKRVKGKPTIGLSFSFQVSQLNETSLRGMNAFTSGLMLYGNENRSYKQLLNYCTSNGINFGINARNETTTVFAKCFKEWFPQVLEMVSEVILKPVFPEEHLLNLKATYKSNLDRIKDYPEHYAAKQWKKLIFGSRSNLINKSGTKTDINNISRKKIIEWYRTHFNPQNLAVAIVGDFNFDEALYLCEKHFVFTKNEFPSSIQKPIYNPNRNRHKTNRNGSNQAIINIGGFGCAGSSFAENTAFHLLAEIIGGATDSRLFSELREQRGLGYSVGMDFHSIKSLGFWNISAVVDKKNANQAIDLIYKVLDSIKKNGVTAAELERVKNFTLGQRLVGDESVIHQAQTLSILDAIGYGYEYYKKRDDRLQQVDEKIIQHLANEYFLKDKMFVHILK